MLVDIFSTFVAALEEELRHVAIFRLGDRNMLEMT